MKRLLAFFARLLAKLAGVAIQPPNIVQDWIDRLGTQDVWDAIRFADQYANATDADKQAIARKYLQETADRWLDSRGLRALAPLSDSAANLMIELIYPRRKEAK